MRLAEQLLFLCVNSKITVCHAISCHMSYVKCSSISKSDCLSCYHMSHKTLTLSLFQSLIHSLSTCWTILVFMSMLRSHSLTLTLTLSHSLIHSLSTCWTTFVFMSMLKSHTLTLSYSHTFTLSHFHTLTLSHFHTFTHSHSQTLTL